MLIKVDIIEGVIESPTNIINFIELNEIGHRFFVLKGEIVF